MAVAAEGSPHAISYLYVVGGEDYVFREVKRRLLKLGVNVVGHAAYRWKNALFEVPKLTTAILVVTDECRNDMRARAHEQAKKWEIPVIEAPAREHWGHAEEALRKYGIIEAMAGVVPIIAAAPPPEALPATPRTTLGDAIAAKGEALTPVPAPAPAPVKRITMAAQPAKTQAAPPAKPTSKRAKEAAQRELILELLRESKGKAGSGAICEIVQKKLGACSVHTVRKVREEGKFPPARPGALSPEQVAFYKKYGIVFTNVGNEVKESERPAKQPRPVPAPKAEQPKPSKPERRGRPAATPDALASDEQVTAAFRDAVRFLDETLVQRLHLTSLTLRLDNGTWQAPEFERVAVTRGTVKLK